MIDQQTLKAAVVWVIGKVMVLKVKKGAAALLLIWGGEVDCWWPLGLITSKQTPLMKPLLTCLPLFLKHDEKPSQWIVVRVRSVQKNGKGDRYECVFY